MPHPPTWWDTFTTHLLTHRHAFYAADAITYTARRTIDTKSWGNRHHR